MLYQDRILVRVKEFDTFAANNSGTITLFKKSLHQYGQKYELYGVEKRRFLNASKHLYERDFRNNDHNKDKETHLCSLAKVV